MVKCLDVTADREEAIISVPESMQVTEDFGRKIVLDLSAPERQHALRMFPVSVLFDAASYANWTMGYLAYHGHASDEAQLLMRFQQEVWLRFQEYRIPVIKLSHDTPRAAVCQVFEKVNTGGVTLSVFELITATFAAEEFGLRPDWEARQKRMMEKRPALQVVDGTAFLTTVTLLASYQRSLQTGKPVSCKRADVLDLRLDDYKKLAGQVEDGYRKAAEILTEEKIFDERELPYTTQLIPFAAICTALADRIDQHSVKQRVLRWFWCGVFGELYGGANETRYALDLPQGVDWVDGTGDPRTVGDSAGFPEFFSASGASVRP
jgi:hypothetical protein